MKKVLFILGLATASLVSAQTEKGKLMVETAVLSNNLTPNTGIGFSSEKDGGKMLNLGLNGGYFIANNLAIKAGVGYGNLRYDKETVSETWSFRGGVEYNILGYFPIEVAWTGSNTPHVDYNPSYLSTQAGYNWFLNDNVAIKPLVRYDVSLTDYYNDVVSVGVGFGFYF